VTLDRRMRILEAKAPSGVKRPHGLSGDALIGFVLEELSKVSDRPDREQARLDSAFLDLLTVDEMMRFLEMLDAHARRDGAGDRHVGLTGGDAATGGFRAQQPMALEPRVGRSNRLLE
jgi:hypothetical protein